MFTMDTHDKDVVWLYGKVRTPPFSTTARMEAGFLLRQLQRGVRLGMPQSRPMPTVDKRCHELRIIDQNVSWRIIYAIEPDAIIILEVFAKKTGRTPRRIIELCKKRLRDYDHASG
jgi:phage-related protein